MERELDATSFLLALSDLMFLCLVDIGLANPVLSTSALTLTVLLLRTGLLSCDMESSRLLQTFLSLSIIELSAKVDALGRPRLIILLFKATKSVDPLIAFADDEASLLRRLLALVGVLFLLTNISFGVWILCLNVIKDDSCC